MRRRLLAIPVIAAASLLLPSAHAALPPQITDPTGDVKGTAAYDIVSVTFDTLKTTTYKTVLVKKGKKTKKKKVATVTPTDFVVTMTLASAPSVAPGTSYQVIAGETPCGIMYAYSYFSARAAAPSTSLQFGNCGPETATGDSFLVSGYTFTTNGNTLVWKAPLKTLPKQIKAGGAFSDLFAYTALTEPLVGYSGVDFAPTPEAAEAAAFDYAQSANVYKFAS